MKKNRVRVLVFGIPVLILILVIVFSMTAGATFTEGLENINTSLLSNFGWLFSVTTLVLVIVCFAVMVSPFGRVRIGGRHAKAKLKTRDVFAIVLCSIVGIGMVTWGTAEVMAHYTSPLPTLGIAPYSNEAADFAMETVMLHWTFPAYATYALPSLLFAFLFYNMKRPFSISEILCPVMGKKPSPRASSVIDCICIFTLLCGLISTIGSTVLALLGGFSYLSEGQLQKNLLIILILTCVIVLAFVISSVTGVMKGIKFLSNLNVMFFVGLALFVVIFGPTAFMFNYGTEGFGNMIQHFFGSMLRTNAVSGSDWSYWWSIFYWAVYMAWAPISAMFIGKVCYGQTVRKVIMLTMVGPSLFTAVWMAIFSGTSMGFERMGYGIADAYLKGYEYTAYAVFEHLPLTLLIILIFLFITCISVVTACDSATDALAGLVMKESDVETIEELNVEEQADTDQTVPGDEKKKNKRKKTWIKILFGVIIGASAVIVVSFSDISGIKMISNIGGFPALWVEILVIIGILKIMKDPRKYDEYKEDYDENGRYLPLPEEQETENVQQKPPEYS